MFCKYFIPTLMAIIFFAPTEDYRCLVADGEVVQFTLGTGRYTKLYYPNTACINETVTCDDDKTLYTATFAVIANGDYVSYISNHSQILTSNYESLSVEKLLFRDDQCYYLQVTGPAVVRHHVQNLN